MGLQQNDNLPVTRFAGIRVSESILGATIPILVGQQRVSWKLLWFGAFNSSIAKSQQGGSGLAKGGTEYVYSASVIGSVCMGNCQNFLAVWDSIGRYAMASYSESGTVPSTGPYNYTPINQGPFKQDLGVSLPTAYTISADDYGSPGSITYSGTEQIPLQYTSSPTPGPGQYTVINTPDIGPFAISSVANAAGGNTVYTGSFPGGASNAFAGFTFATKGSNFPANNGQFAVVASTTTTITLNNPSGIADTAVMEALSVMGTPIYVFNAAQAGQSIIVNYVAWRWAVIETELDVVPPSGIITVQYQAFQPFKNISVTYYPSGIALTPVSGTPTAPGTYNPNDGNYEFYVGSGPNDLGAGVSITYAYNNQNSGSDVNASNTINLTFFGGGLGQEPWSYLSSSFPSAALGYSEVAYVGSSGLYLGYSPLLPQYNFEILGPYSYGAGIPDVNPADAIYALLINPSYKLNFPLSNIHSSLLGAVNTISGSVTSGTFTSGELVKQSTTGATALLIGTVTGSNPMVIGLVTGPTDPTHTWVGQTSEAVYTPTTRPFSSSARAMWATNNFFISEVIDSQTSLMAIMTKWCTAGQCYITWDEGLLKFIPLYDTTSYGNGMGYNPPTQPVIDLDDNDFVIKKNENPITIEQTPWQNRWNKVQVRWSVRTNDYNEDILQIQDEASVQQYGLMQETVQDYQFICTETAAQFAANMRLQRFSAIYTKYSFTLKSNLAFLSPGDIITITDGLLGTSGTMFGRTPCRITKMTDDPKKGISIEAENFPWSVGAALLYNKQAQLPSNTNDGPQENPGDTIPIIFEVPNQAARWNGDVIYIFANGTNSNWGGFQVYVSFNGVDYNYYGQYTTPARIGTTTADYPTVSFTAADLPVLDSTDTLSVNMNQSGAALQSVTSADLDAYVTLSALVSPGQTFDPTNVAGTGSVLGTSTGGGVTAGNQGPLNTTAVTQVAVTTSPPGHSTAWTNITGVEGTASYAQCSLTISGGYPESTYNLLCTNFNLTPPVGAGLIVGLQIGFQAYYSGWPGGNTGSLLVTLLYQGSTIGSANFVWNGSSVPTTPTVFTLGSLTNLTIWGLPTAYLTPAIVSDPSFGVQIGPGGMSGSGSATLEIQNVSISIAWAAGGAASSWSNPNYVSSTSSYATATLAYSSLTQFLVATNYNFNLPFGFVLEGVEVTIHAYVSTGTANVSASLYADQLIIGISKSISITSTPTDYTFGTPTDFWAAVNYLDIDTLNSAGFGVALQAQGLSSDTIYINNVRITLYGTSTSNLELIAYETVALIGQNSYAITNILRGVLGSYPCDHPTGSTFARMDQATLTYDVPPNYVGETIYFKFLSFNAYGNQLQTLSEVVAYEVPVGGLSPGAIDPATGNLRTGTTNFSVPQIEAVTLAAHGPFGIQNIPAGYGWVVPPTGGTGTPQWLPVISGGGGAGGVVNLYVIAISGDYSAAAWDDLICNTAAGSFNVTYPAASASQNVGIGVVKKTADSNTVTILPTGSDTIEGASSLVLSGGGEAVLLISDGISNWEILSGWNGTGYSQLAAPAWLDNSDASGSVFPRGSNGGFGPGSGGAANKVWVMMFRLYYPFSFNTISFYINSGVSGLIGLGIYDKNGNQLIHWDSISGLGVGGDTTATPTGGAQTLQPGDYYWAWSFSVGNTAGPVTNGGLNTEGSNSNTMPYNRSVVRAGSAANSMSGGVLPATLGTLTAGVQLTLPYWVVEP
jgi:Putative phage tail protein